MKTYTRTFVECAPDPEKSGSLRIRSSNAHSGFIPIETNSQSYFVREKKAASLSH